MIKLELGLKLSDDINIGNLTTWDYYSSAPTSDGSIFKCMYWDSVSNSWSDEGINQTATVVDFENDKITCESTHMSAFTLVVEKEQPIEVITIETTVESEEEDDDWNYLKHLNALYISVGLVVLMSLLLIGGLAADKKSGTVEPALSDLRPSTSLNNITAITARQPTGLKHSKVFSEVQDISQDVQEISGHAGSPVDASAPDQMFRPRSGPKGSATE